MKKIELHLDALVVIFVVFVLAAAFLIYQRHQYSIVTQENVDLLWENSDLEANLVIKNAQLDKCQSFVSSINKAKNVTDDALFPRVDLENWSSSN